MPEENKERVCVCLDEGKRRERKTGRESDRQKKSETNKKWSQIDKERKRERERER